MRPGAYCLWQIQERKRQIHKSVMCYSRNMDKMGREARGQLDRPSRRLAEIHPVESPIREFIVHIKNSQLSHETQKCGDVLGDEARKR